MEPRTADALAALEGLPPFVGDERRRAELATEAYRIAGDVVGALASGEPTPPRLGRLIQVGRALAPDRPLEPSFRDAVFGHVTRVGRSSDLPLAVTLVELFPDDRVVQRRCGSLAEEPGCSPAQRKVFLRAIRRTVELTDDPAERQEVEIGLCQLLSRLGKNEEVITLATRLLERLQAPIARAAVLLIRGARSATHTSSRTRSRTWTSRSRSTR